MRQDSEQFAVTATLQGSASNGLPFLYHEVATLDVPDMGEVRIGMHANMATMYVMLPGGKGPKDGAPPHLFALSLAELFQAATRAAVERHATGEPVKGPNNVD